MKTHLFALTALSLALTACENTHQTNADNTARNARDRNGHTLTPIDQSETEADRAITQKIRQALVEEEVLSTNGKNVKIITINGIVTLRGPVNSEDEKNQISKKAKSINGVKNVDNQLEVIREIPVKAENR
ncbi:Uncharacterized protein PRO82_001854 [Candidatus Protochlamydia amoebophila]|uniref:BON domain-containing protein n=1 Tax=Candidatus Protochlamydia amoebophila TaxID=362787 RepID=UPI001BC9EF67|nr:BON domain-containing protein [Candidatus Protochlamydia amoebophila]MBS4164525.1 Uncharacterized protein [Candidatus Protochlamydia amoebophila]